MKRFIVFITLLLSTISFVSAQNNQWIIYESVNSNANLGLYNVLSIVIDGSDNLWFAVPTYGLAKYNGESWTTYNYSNSGIPKSTVISVTIEENDIKWIGTQDSGLVKFDGINWTIYKTSNSGLPHNTVIKTTIDKNGNKWVGTANGLAKFDGTNWTTYNTSNSGLPNNYIRAIVEDKNGNMWIGTGAGLAKFDGASWTVYNTSNSGLEADPIRSIAIDKGDTLWIGTAGYGLTKFDGINWITYRSGNSDLHVFYAIAIDEDDNKWIGSGYGGIAKFDGKSWTVYNTSNSLLPDNNVRSLVIDKNGTKWIGTFWGLAAYNENDVPGASFLNVSSSTLTIGASANSTQTFDITSNMEWIISSDQSWLTPNNSSGSNNATIELTATANPTITNRTAIVTVAATGVASQTITVTQELGTTGTQESENLKTILFPNPTTDYFKIRLSSSINVYQIEIFNLNGTKVKCESIKGQLEIDLTDLSEGVYMVRLYTNNGLVIKKLIKQ